MKTKIIYIVATLLFVDSCSNVPTEGILPSDYSWAYGLWEITYKGEGVDSTPRYIYIGADYLQSLEDFQGVTRVEKSSEKEEFYPIYTLPKLKYNIPEQKYYLEENSQNELCITYSGCWDYVNPLYLNKAKKTVSHYTESDVKRINEFSELKIIAKKRKIKIDNDIINEYEEKLRDSKYWGDWKAIKSRVKITLSYPSDETDLLALTKSGKLVSLSGVYSIKEDGNRLIYYYSNTEDYVSEEYKRYDAEAERQSRLRALVAGEQFSNMTQIGNGLAIIQTLLFNRDGTGVCATGDVSMIGVNYTDKTAFRWEVSGNRIKTNIDGESIYFTVENWPRTAIVSSSNTRYTKDLTFHDLS